MSRERRNRASVWWPVAVVVLLLYAVGYFTLSDKTEVFPEVYRDFRSRPLCRMYWPLGWCESKLTGKSVYHVDDNRFINIFLVVQP